MSICFTQPIHHTGDRLHLAPPPRRRPLCLQGLSIRTFNICDGRGFGLVQDIRLVQIDGFNLMVMTETKVTNKAYCQNRMGYDVVC